MANIDDWVTQHEENKRLGLPYLQKALKEANAIRRRGEPDIYTRIALAGLLAGFSGRYFIAWVNNDIGYVAQSQEFIVFEHAAVYRDYETPMIMY